MEKRPDITLYQFPRMWGIPNPSPFCVKIETYLRMAGLDYKVAPNGDLRKAPKGKFPYISDSERVIADSAFIVDYLVKTYGDRVDNHLSAREKAEAHAVGKMCEESLYWTALYSRWVEPQNWTILKADLFKMLPPLLRGIIPGIVRKRVFRDLRGQGYGRHNRDEVYSIGKKDLQALSDYLGEKDFIMGDKPSSIDATVFGMLINLLSIPVESPLKGYGLEMNNLNAYCERMKEKYFQADS